MIQYIFNVKVIGNLNNSQIKALKEIELVTTESNWEGIEGVYCDDGVVVNDQSLLGYYMTSYPNDLRFDVDGITYSNFKHSIILIDSGETEQPHQFAFILLHELGHHVDRISNNKTLRVGTKDDEIEAHKFAIKRYRKMNLEKGDIFNMPYLKEALNELDK
jgi:hypothetical protein